MGSLWSTGFLTIDHRKLTCTSYTTLCKNCNMDADPFIIGIPIAVGIVLLISCCGCIIKRRQQAGGVYGLPTSAPIPAAVLKVQRSFFAGAR